MSHHFKILGSSTACKGKLYLKPIKRELLKDVLTCFNHVFYYNIIFILLSKKIDFQSSKLAILRYIKTTIVFQAKYKTGLWRANFNISIYRSPNKLSSNKIRAEQSLSKS